MYIGYKQKLEYFNSIPKDCEKIYELSDSLCKCRYYPDATKTDNIEDFLKRSERYFFSFAVKNKTNKAYTKICCYYDSEKEAKATFKELQDKYFHK